MSRLPSSSVGRVLYALASLALLAAACGNSEDDTESAPPTAAEQTPVPVDEPDPTEAPVEQDDAGDEPAGDPDDQPADEPTAEPGATDPEDEFVPIEGVPGVSDEQITFAVIGTKEGNPLGTCILDCYIDGIQAYFDFRNAEGGLFGRELALGEVLDDELFQNQVRSLEVIANNRDFGVFSATLLASGWGDLDAEGVPVFAWNIHSTEFADRPSIIGHFPATCAECSQRGVPYALFDSGKTMFASIGYGASENSKVCTQSVADSVELYAADIGATVVYVNDELAFGLPNGIAPEVTAMKAAGVDFISTCMDLNGMKTLAQELDRQDMADVVLYHPNTYNHSFVAEAGELFEGDYVSPQFLPFEADTGNQAQADFKASMEQNGSELSELAMIGWINADQAYQGILAAGPEFDRQAVIDASNSFTAYDAGGLINALDWTRQHTPPTEGNPDNDYRQECTALVIVRDGAFETVAPPQTPWLCWDTSTLAWSEPTPVSFD